MSKQTPSRTTREKIARVKLTGLTRLSGTLSALCIAALMCVLPTPNVDAATQGPFSYGSSTGSVDVDLVLGLRARITGLADMPLGDWSGSGPMTANDNICVGVNYFGGTYRIRASGDGAPGDPSAFTLSNGSSQITYDAYFNDTANAGAGRVQLTGGVTLTGQTGSFLKVFNYLFGCVSNNANISIEVPESELAGGTGTYNGTLTLLLLPE